MAPDLSAGRELAQSIRRKAAMPGIEQHDGQGR
jgi:hypothetical protein